MFWLNFIVVTVAYVALSFRIFHITAGLRDSFIPKEGGTALAYRGVLVAVVVPVFWSAGAALKAICA